MPDVPLTNAKAPIDAAALKALTDSLPIQAQTAGVFVRHMRDRTRY